MNTNVCVLQKLLYGSGRSKNFRYNDQKKNIQQQRKVACYVLILSSHETWLHCWSVSGHKERQALKICVAACQDTNKNRFYFSFELAKKHRLHMTQHIYSKLYSFHWKHGKSTKADSIRKKKKEKKRYKLWSWRNSWYTYQHFLQEP